MEERKGRIRRGEVGRYGVRERKGVTVDGRRGDEGEGEGGNDRERGRIRKGNVGRYGINYGERVDGRRVDER